MATGAEVLQMDKAAAELQRLRRAAMAWAEEQEGALLGAWLRSSSEAAILKAIRDEDARAEKWLTTWRSWAQRGLDGEGYPYSVAFYLGVGRDIASAFALYMKEAANQDVFRLTAEATTTQVTDTVKKAADVAGDAVAFVGSTRGKVLLAAGAAVVLGGALALSRIARP
ncbi:hypothetical protein [Hyalangium gracile]|uniref:hypothetical protein n=1 Tax=Hyalangium gracile TaxID=394092 RepID=UPI001CC9A537|nr:hypothetical protein [Hyalangium gracile]